jgi:hypothetical protein
LRRPDATFADVPVVKFDERPRDRFYDATDLVNTP